MGCEEEVALENRGSELALVSRQADRKSDEGRCILAQILKVALLDVLTNSNLQQCAFRCRCTLQVLEK